MRQVIFLGFMAVLAGCGGGRDSGWRDRGPMIGTPVASGPISAACTASDRKARSRKLCGCIQYAANQTLSASQQRRAVAFYRDPHRAQEIRQSDRGSDERFWRAYRAYGERAERLCR